MKFTLPAEKVPNQKAAMRRAGYFEFTDPNTGEHSYVLQLGQEFYPRFHLYIEEKAGQLSFNLHLDQKKPSYGQNHAHAGEYDGSTVEKELKRVAGWVMTAGRV
jgi:hypothetical protein